MLNSIDPAIVSAVISIVGSLLGILAGSAAAWYFARHKYKAEIKKDDADAAAAITDAARGLIDPLNDQIRELKGLVSTIQSERNRETIQHASEINSLRADMEIMRQDLFRKEGVIQELRGGVDVLIGQLKQLGVAPKYDPGH